MTEDTKGHELDDDLGNRRSDAEQSEHELDDDVGNRLVAGDAPAEQSWSQQLLQEQPAAARREEGAGAFGWHASAGCPEQAADEGAAAVGHEQAEDLGEHVLATQFNRLTPEEILDAVEAGGVRCTGRFIILNSYENRVYQLELEDGRWVVGKFYRPGRWSRETILAEHRFLAELEEAELPVACPLQLGTGSTVGEVDGILYSLFPRVGGRAPDELDDEQLQVLGRLIARIHNVGAQAPEPDRPLLTIDTYGRENLAWLLEHEVIPPEARDIYAETVQMLLLRVEPLFRGVPVHRIHGDCHLGNLIESPAGMTFLDFDDMVVGPAVQDIWMMVPSFDAYGQAQRETLLEAYTEFRDFSLHWLRLIEPLRALRFIRYSTWIARRWHDPIFRRTFGHFGTLLYWQKEIQDLREQIARLDLQDAV